MIYEYKCVKCGELFEKIISTVKLRDLPISCIKCSGPTRRIPTRPSKITVEPWHIKD